MLSRARSRRAAVATGFTLVEALIALAILETAVLAVVYTMTAGAKQTVAGDQVWRAGWLAEDLMEEIVCLDYADQVSPTSFGTEAGESARADFDDIDDYNGFAESTGKLTRLSGGAYADEFQIFSRSVSVVNTTQTLTDIGVDVYGRTVTITVTKPSGETWQLQRFVANPSQGGA